VSARAPAAWKIVACGDAERTAAGELIQTFGSERLLQAIDFANTRAFLKLDVLRGSARRRHGLARLLARKDPPRVREYVNLRWLDRRYFRVLEPLAAGVQIVHGLPRAQFLVTRALDTHGSLLEHLSAPGSERATLLAEVAREVGRMHALHFTHRDLFLRNLLVAEPEFGRRVVFSDCWAGGPGVGRRSAAYDLACFFLDAADLLEPEEQARFLDDYRAACAAQGRALAWPRFLARVAGARRALWHGLERDVERRRGRALPMRDWTLPPH